MVQTLQNFIGGEFVPPAGTELLDIVNPTNGEIVAKAPISIGEDVDRAMAAAQDAFGAWKHVTPGERQRLLLQTRARQGALRLLAHPHMLGALILFARQLAAQETL